MKKLLCIAFVASLVLACTSSPTTPPASPLATSLMGPLDESIASDLEGKTVALYALGRRAPQCTGVWIADNRILTAAHCVSKDVEDPNFYSTREEYTGFFVKPRAFHSMQVVRTDESLDLAIYRTGVLDTPRHVVAPIAPFAPAVGDTLHMLGHPMGFAWSYRQGPVSFYRESGENGEMGAWMQVSAPITSGDSGGGAFNAKGELVGIALRVSERVPNLAFYAGLGTLRKFLAAP